MCNRLTGDVFRLVTLPIVPGSRRIRKQSTWSQNALPMAVALPFKAKLPVFNCGRIQVGPIKRRHCQGTALKRDFLIPRLASRLVEGVVSLIDGLSGLRWFSRFCTVSVLGRSIQNLHLVGHNFDCRALLAFTACPLPSLQSAFDVDMATLDKPLTAHFCQAAKADDLKPLHAFPASALGLSTSR